MVSELESIKELENELLKVRLTITEKEQEREKIQKTNDGLTYGAGFMGFLTFCAYFGENKLVMLIPGSILVILMFFAFKNTFKISKLIQEINLAKKKKKQLEDRLKALSHLAKVKAKKEQG